MRTTPEWKRKVNNDGSISQDFKPEAFGFVCVVMDTGLPVKPWSWRTDVNGRNLSVGRADTESSAKWMAISAGETDVLKVIAGELLKGRPDLTAAALGIHLRKAVADAELHLDETEVDAVAHEMVP